jgi:hypothetical protein
MTPVGWAETAASERVANLRREAARERLLRSGRHGNKARHGGSGRWGGGVGRVLAGPIGRQRGSSWPDPELLTQPGDRS